MKPLALALAAASTLAMVSTAPAFARHGYSEGEMVNKFMRIFDRLDHNRNGRISRSGIRHLEDRGSYRDGPRVAVVFGDENFRIAFGTGGRRHGNHRDRYIGPINTSTFYLYDIDGDGYIYRRELRRAVIREFHYADRNGDGYLSDYELERSAWYRTSLRRTSSRYYPNYRRHQHRPTIVIRTDNHRHRDHHDRNRDRYRDRDRDRHHDRDGYRDRDRHRDRDGYRDRDRRHRDGTRTERTRDRTRDGSRTERTRERTRDGSRTERKRTSTKRDGDRKRNRDREERRDRDEN